MTTGGPKVRRAIEVLDKRAAQQKAMAKAA
jgi:hypothetical protein